MKAERIDLTKAYASIQNYFSPKVVGEVNDQYVKIAKIKGEDIPWHTHENEDELFLVIQGSLLMEVEHMEPFTLNSGELFIVPKGVNHRVSSENECLIMLVESKSTRHTGDVQTDITKSIEDQLY